MAVRAEAPGAEERMAAQLAGLAEVPSATKAWISAPTERGGATLTVVFAQRNLASNSLRKCTVTGQLTDGPAGPVTVVGLPAELRDVQLLSLSPSGSCSLLARAGTESTSTVLEVWCGCGVLKELHVPKAQHGAVFGDGWFSGCTWSPDEQRVAYVAEEPAQELPEWGRWGCAVGGKDGEAMAAPKAWRGVGAWQEDWGELYTAKRAPALFLLDLRTWTVARVHGLPADSSAALPVWDPEGTGLVCVVWPHRAPNFPALPSRLGAVHCANRPCGLWHVRVPDADGAAREGATCLTPGLLSATSPRFSPDGALLVFLSHEGAAASGVHNATAELLTLPWPPPGDVAAARQVVVPVRPAHQGEAASDMGSPGGLGAFPGIYALSLPDQPFLSERTVLVTTQWRSLQRVISVDLTRGAVKADCMAESQALLACAHGWAASVTSAPNKLPHVIISRCRASDTDAAAWPPAMQCGLLPAWTPRAEPLHRDSMETRSASTPTFGEVHWEVMQVERPSGPCPDCVEVEAIVVHTGSARPLPGILWPHGGPHSAHAATFRHAVAFMAMQGYACILPNFRGSLGFGEDSVQALPGRIGTLDVEDCIAALDAAIAKGLVDPDRVAAMGGSHGGFLTGHLVGQHAQRFRAGVLQNPVMDLSLMTHVTDIPDWCYVEAYGVEEGRRRMAACPTLDDLAQFRRVSPIAHVDKVTAPLLFILGGKDRRVPLADSHRYIAAVRARPGAPEVRVLQFAEDTHALDKPQSDFEHWMNAAAWLQRHL